MVDRGQAIEALVENAATAQECIPTAACSLVFGQRKTSHILHPDLFKPLSGTLKLLWTDLGG